MLKINNVEVMYNKVILVLRGVTLEVGDKQLVALLGANGAGKTTLLKAVSGLLHTELGEVTDGSVEFDGERIDRKNTHIIAKMGIVQVMEGRALFEHMTVDDNIVIGAHLRNDRDEVKRDLHLVYEYFPTLQRLKRRTSGYLSGGEQQMLVISRALMSQPRVMLLDEPSLGLGPIMVEEIFSIIEKIHSEERRAILLVEQNAIAALCIANHGYVLENGRVVLEGPAQKLIENEDVKEFYLGLSAVGKRKSYREVKHYKRRKRWL